MTRDEVLRRLEAEQRAVLSGQRPVALPERADPNSRVEAALQLLMRSKPMAVDQAMAEQEILRLRGALERMRCMEGSANEHDRLKALDAHRECGGYEVWA